MFTIEKDIPVYKLEQSKSPGRPKGSKYPFKDMEIGDSFFIPGKKRFSLTVYTRKYAPEGCMFIQRQKSTGVRVWLVKVEEKPQPIPAQVRQMTEIDKDVPVDKLTNGFQMLAEKRRKNHE